MEQELQKARQDLREASRGYEEYIKELTKELWNVGEKFVMKHDEAEWLRKKQRHGSLMSLQHVHSVIYILTVTTRFQLTYVNTLICITELP